MALGGGAGPASDISMAEQPEPSAVGRVNAMHFGRSHVF
jgi:hypothetical protein